MSRLNDTKAIVDLPLRDENGREEERAWARGSKPTRALRSASGDRDTFPANPDAGRAVTARRDLPGVAQYSYNWEEGDIVPRPGRIQPNPGCSRISEAMNSQKSSVKLPKGAIR